MFYYGDGFLDIATLLGFIGACGIVGSAILLGGSASVFVNVPSLLIVIGGTMMITLMKITLADFFNSIKIGLVALLYKSQDVPEIIELAVGLADVARKNGLLALEGQDVENEFLMRGISLCVDGHDPQFIQKMLAKDINLSVTRHEKAQDIFMGVADTAPAMGMIGTLIGLVQMLSTMDDPATIGPSMAVALLTTMYGAMIATMICIPVAKKLEMRAHEEKLNKQMILEIIMGIQESLNPKVLEQLLKTYLPGNKRADADADAEGEE